MARISEFVCVGEYFDCATCVVRMTDPGKCQNIGEWSLTLARIAALGVSDQLPLLCLSITLMHGLNRRSNYRLEFITISLFWSRCKTKQFQC